MVAGNFQASLKAVLESEGGNDDDPSDHGGRTSRGITQREYDAWSQENKIPRKDVWKATHDEIETIYHDEYWAPYCDLLPSGVDYLYFDMRVNAGPYRATVLLQSALGITADGRMGPITRQAVGKADARDLIVKYTEVKQAFYRSLHQPKYLKGWLNRCLIVQSNATHMLQQ